MKQNATMTLIMLGAALVFTTLCGRATMAQTPGGCARPAFAPAANFTVPVNAKSVTSGDFNNDGKPDIATTEDDGFGDRYISILLNDGSGGFSISSFEALDTPGPIRADDFNKDGKLDFVTGNFNFKELYHGNGAGGFAETTSVAGGVPFSLISGDFNGDGNLDLAEPGAVYFGNGAGGFSSPVTFGTGNAPTGVAAEDFNGDGKLDLATANFQSDNVAVVLNNGAGGFSQATYFAVDDGPFSLTVGDFNGDGKVDIASASNQSRSVSYKVSVLLGNGDGGFAPAVDFPTGSNPQSIVAADFNRDGKLDLATANQNGGNVSVLLGDGAGSFAAPFNFAVGSGPRFVIAADFNSDTKPDLATANYDAGSVSVLISTCRENNTAPVANDDSYTVTEDTTLNIAASGVLANDTDPENDPLTAIRVSDPAHGSLTFNSDGSFSYTPAANYFGPDSFTYKSSDNDRESATVTVSITVEPVNDPPVAVDEFVFIRDGANTINVLANDVDVDGDQLMVVSITQPNHGIVAINGSGTSVTYTPTPGYHGPDSFIYTMSDGQGSSDTAAVDVARFPAEACVAVNFLPPQTVPIVATAVMTGDFNEDGKPDLVASNPNNGDVSLSLGDGAGGFGTPQLLQSGASSATTGDFNADGNLDIATANGSGSVSVLLGNGAGGFAGPRNTAVSGNPRELTVGDFNRDGKLDLATTMPSIFSASRVATILGDGMGGFGPAQYFNLGNNSFPQSITTGDFNGDNNPDLATTNLIGNSLSVLLGDGTGGMSAPVSYPVSNGPWGVATADFNSDDKLDLAVGSDAVSNGDISVFNGDGLGGFSRQTFTAGQRSQSITVGDFNRDGWTDIVAGDLNGNIFVLLNNANGGFGAPHPFAAGDFPVSLAAADLDGDGALDLVTANIRSGNVSILLNRCAPNTAPAANNDAYATDEDITLTDAAPGVLTNDTDGEGDTVTASLVTGPAHGTLTLSSNGSFSYTPAGNYFGSDSFTYKTSDGELQSGLATVTITVNSVNDAPTGVNDSFNVGRNTVANPISVLSNDTDPENDTLSVSSVTQGSHGTVAITDGGSKVGYTPEANYAGPDTFTYRVSDGQLESPPVTVSITVLAPTAANVSISGRIFSPQGGGADGRAISKALILIRDSSGFTRATMSNNFGYYTIKDIPAGSVYIVSVSAKGWSFFPRPIMLIDNVGGFNISPDDRLHGGK